MRTPEQQVARSAGQVNIEACAIDEQYSVERSDDRFRTLPMRSPMAFKAAYLQRFIPDEQNPIGSGRWNLFDHGSVGLLRDASVTTIGNVVVRLFCANASDSRPLVRLL